ncbi:MAG: hypothetical protein JOZ38_09110 [Candidatus Eremiobacteraeota bacterium]|nr:hypothetical protein [Candidatus Eremiobacteraeota bacterium]
MPIPIHFERKPQETIADTEFGFILLSFNPGSFSGSIEFYGASRAYQRSFVDVSLYRNRDTGVYSSEPHYVTFPQPFAFEAAWVETEQRSGVAATCETFPVVTHNDLGRSGAQATYRWFSDAGSAAMSSIRAHAPPVASAAVFDGTVDLKGCDEFYRSARAVSPARLEAGDAVNLGRPLAAEVEIFIGGDGTAQRFSILDSSGIAQFDRAVIDQARRTRYAAAQFLCLPVASVYRLKSTMTQ